MRYKSIMILLLIQLTTVFVHAQEGVDTLVQMLRDHPAEDTTRMLIWATLAKEYTKTDLDKSLPASDSVIRLAQILNKPGWVANAYNVKGAVYMYKADYAQALQSFKSALAIAEQIDNKRRISQSLTNIAAVYVQNGDYNKALENFQKAVDISAAINQKDGVGVGYSNIGAIYMTLGNLPKAVEFEQKALKVNEEIGNKHGIAICYSNLSSIYSGLGDYEKSITYGKMSLQINEEAGDMRSKVHDLTNLANVQESSDNFSDAIQYRLQAIDIAKPMNLSDDLLRNFISLQYDYGHLPDYSKALEYCEEAKILREKIGQDVDDASQSINEGCVYGFAPASLLAAKGIDTLTRYDHAIKLLLDGINHASEKQSLYQQRNGWLDISEIYKGQGDYIKALEAFQNYIRFRDSLVNDEKKKQITRLEIQYEYNKAEDSLKLQQQVTDEKLKQQTSLAKQKEQELELRKNELALSNKEKDIQNLAFLKSQADLQNEQLEKQKADKQLTIAEKEKQLQQEKVKNLSQQQTLSKLQLQQQWFYSIGILFLIVVAASWFIYNNRLKAGKLKAELAKEKAEQEKKEAEFQRSLADISMSALRSQMNPHFIFNCLNSIKLYTTQNNTTAASEYLTKFSRLIRMALENSRNETITLTAELEALELYIQMEGMRFKDKLAYSITVDKNVDADYIEIPPLLLQPYVENAIWHGLMQKEEGGRINIHAAMAEKNLLVIKIRDNGVGRAVAQERQSKTSVTHKSYGMKVTSERLALINKIYKTGASITIDDLKDHNNLPEGTLVTIQIPVA